MSATLYALVIWQGASGLAFQPGYTSKEECQAVYHGPHVICWQYDPSITTWTAFFRTTEGPASPKGFGAVWRFPNESICRDYINALKPEAFGACRQLPHPELCPVSCRVPEPAPPPPAAKPEPDIKPDPAALTYRTGQECETGWSQQQCTRWRLEAGPAIATTQPAIQLAGGHYEAGFHWVEDEHSIKVADKPFLEPRVEFAARQLRTAAPKPPTQTQQPPEPFKALIDVVMLPFDFLSYPARRDW